MSIWMNGKSLRKDHCLKFYSNLDLKDITDADYMHTKRVCKENIYLNIMICILKAIHYF